MQGMIPGMGMNSNSIAADIPVVDTSEMIHISSLALLKMLKHGNENKT